MLFGMAKKNEGIARTTIHLPPDVMAMVKREKGPGRSIKAFLTAAILHFSRADLKIREEMFQAVAKYLEPSEAEAADRAVDAAQSDERGSKGKRRRDGGAA